MDESGCPLLSTPPSRELLNAWLLSPRARGLVDGGVDGLVGVTGDTVNVGDVG